MRFFSLLVFIFSIICCQSYPPNDNCKEETFGIVQCAKNNPVEFRNWRNGTFDTQVPFFNNWLECVGKPMCANNIIFLESQKIQAKVISLWSKNLSSCFENDVDEHLKAQCQKIMDGDCENPDYVLCAMEFLSEQKSCSSEDVHNYKKTIPDMIKVCQLRHALKYLKDNSV